MEKNVKKERWELAYENFKNGDLSEEIKSLADKLRNEDSPKKRDEVKENLKKATKKHDNMEKNKGKIENIIEFKKVLVEKTAEIIEKLEKIEELEKDLKTIDNDLVKLDAEREKTINEVRNIDNELKNLENELKNTQLSPEERAKKEQEKAKKYEDKQSKLNSIRENDYKYSELSKSKNELQEKQNDTTKKDDLKKEILRNEQLIAKCNLIGANLIKGKSMEDIKAQLTNFTFTPNKDFAKKIKAIREMKTSERENVAKEEKINSENEVIIGKSDLEKGEPAVKGESETKGDAGQGLAVQTKFEKYISNHPKLDKFFKKFPKVKNIANKIADLFTKKEEVNEYEEVEKNTEPFVEYIDPADLDKTDDMAKLIDDEFARQEASDSYDWINRKMQQRGEDDVLAGITEKGVTGFKESLFVEAGKKQEDNKMIAAVEYARKYGKNADGTINKDSPYYHQDGIER